MPYIKQEDRKLFDKVLKKFEEIAHLDGHELPAGKLNYLISSIIKSTLGDNPNYARYNEIIGMLECCKLELYRRMVAKYEDSKATLNGDVYE